MTGPYDITQISLGDGHSCARRLDGTAWCWGSGDSGELGAGSDTDSPVPVQVLGLTGVAQISAGYAHTCALRTDGTVWCWGAGLSGALGNGEQRRRFVPARVSL